MRLDRRRSTGEIRGSTSAWLMTELTAHPESNNAWTGDPLTRKVSTPEGDEMG